MLLALLLEKRSVTTVLLDDVLASVIDNDILGLIAGPIVGADLSEDLLTSSLGTEANGLGPESRELRGDSRFFVSDRRGSVSGESDSFSLIGKDEGHGFTSSGSAMFVTDEADTAVDLNIVDSPLVDG